MHHSLLCEGSCRHTLSITASGHQILYHHRTAHRLHGQAIPGNAFSIRGSRLRSNLPSQLCNPQKPLEGRDKRSVCCFCCRQGVVSMKAYLERSAYCCGESIRLKADIDNQSEEIVRLKLKLVQVVAVLLISRNLTHLLCTACWLQHRARSARSEQRSCAHSARVPGRGCCTEPKVSLRQHRWIGRARHAANHYGIE